MKTKQTYGLKELQKYIYSLTAEEIQEIAQNWLDAWDVEVSTAEEIYEVFAETREGATGYDVDCACADGFTLEEFVFWWR